MAHPVSSLAQIPASPLFRSSSEPSILGIHAQKTSAIAFPDGTQQLSQPYFLGVHSSLPSIQPGLENPGISQQTLSYQISPEHTATFLEQHAAINTFATRSLLNQPSSEDRSTHPDQHEFAILSRPYAPSDHRKSREQDRFYRPVAPYPCPQNNQNYVPEYTSQTHYSYQANHHNRLFDPDNPLFSQQQPDAYMYSHGLLSAPHQYNNQLFPFGMGYFLNLQSSVQAPNGPGFVYDHNNLSQNSTPYPPLTCPHPVTYQDNNEPSLSQSASRTDTLWHQHNLHSKNPLTQPLSVRTSRQTDSKPSWKKTGEEQTMLTLLERLDPLPDAQRQQILRAKFPNRSARAVRDKYERMKKDNPSSTSNPNTVHLHLQPRDLNSVDQEESNKVYQTTESNPLSPLSDLPQEISNIPTEWTLEEMKVLKVVEELRPLLSSIGVVKPSEFNSDPLFRTIVEISLQNISSNRTFFEYTTKRDALFRKTPVADSSEND